MELLKKLSEIYSPSGNEEGICSFIADEIRKYADEVYIDVMGNCIARKKGNGKKIMYVANTDEAGFRVIYIEENGFLRFSAFGGADAKISALSSAAVVFENGVRGVISCEKRKSDEKTGAESDMYIDIGAASREEAEKKVSPGDTAVLVSGCYETADKIFGKALCGRVGVYVLTEAIKKIKSNENDLYFVFSSQKEVGGRGAKTAAFSINPDYAIVLDAVEADDVPGADGRIGLGKGVAIRVSDKSFIADIELKNRIENAALKNNIKYQTDVSATKTSIAGAVQLAKCGIKTAAITYPVRYLYTAYEIADKNDVFEAVRLMNENIF